LKTKTARLFPSYLCRGTLIVNASPVQELAMVRLFSLVFGLFFAVAPVGSAQTPITVTAEAVVSVSIKPDQAKIYLNVDSKAGDASSAVEVATAARKELVAAIEKLGVKGASLTTLPQKITKDRANPANFGIVAPGGAPAQPPAESYSISQMVICTVSEADPISLGAAVEKITHLAAGQGITGDKAQADTNVYNPFGGSTKNGARVAYSSKSGWDDALTAGLIKATDKALKNAKVMAKAAELKLEGVISVEEVPEPAPAHNESANANPYVRLLGIGGGSAAEEEYADGELTRKVRVRVKVAVVR
jgi:uncharacterized protein YggE